MNRRSAALATAAVFVGATAASGQFVPPQQVPLDEFVNWETGQVHPLEMTPDGSTLLAVNTADNRLEVFSVNLPGVPTLVDSIPVGLDPVTVRARSNTEVWVVNHLSDSISIVDLSAGNVTATVTTADEPCDVVFAGSAGNAFVSCSQPDLIQVFNPTTHIKLLEIPLLGQDPQALDVSPDGNTVYCAIFESGNASTVLNGGHGLDLNRIVNNLATPHGGVNPPPNAPGGTFDPPQNPANPAPPRVGLIVKKNDQGQWLDDTGADWTQWVSGADAGMSNRPVGWDMPDRDVAIIDANAMTVSGYVNSLMNMVMDLSVNPHNGEVYAIGTDGINEVRFEPVINGTFHRVLVARYSPSDQSTVVKDLNAHIDYNQISSPPLERLKSLGDPRAIVWDAAGERAFIAGMGSNNIIEIDVAGDRVPDPQQSATDLVFAHPSGGIGPTGLYLDDSRDLLYVLNRFSAEVTVLPLDTLSPRLSRSFFDPTPDAIRDGRPVLYDTLLTSGHGHSACASCHVNARIDRLAWDLGVPDELMEVGAILDQNLGAGMPGFEPGSTFPQFQDWHPMKGPMTTQTLQDIIGQEPHHWRGDRFGIEEFSGAFVGLLGDDAEPSPQQMQDFEGFLDTITFPPNPFRNFDNSLPTALDMPQHFTTGRFGPPGQPLPAGDAENGLALFVQPNMDAGVSCHKCHTMPTGSGTDMEWDGTQFVPFPTGPMGETHRMLMTFDGQTNITMKVAQLRNMHEKTGFNVTQLENSHGFGFLHDGTISSIEHFVGLGAFQVQSDQEIADLTAFMLAFAGSDLPDGNILDLDDPPGGTSQDTHAAVGVQTTVLNGTGIPLVQRTLIGAMIDLADDDEVGIVVKGVVAGEQRGYTYIEAGASGPSVGFFQSDRQGETLSIPQMVALASPAGELTWTVTPYGSQVRIGIDRDKDTWLDRDELDVCADPADPTLFPGSQSSIDANGDLIINTADFITFLNLFVAQDPLADFDRNGFINTADFIAFLNAWVARC